MAVGRDPRTGRYIGSTFLKNNFEKCLLPLLVSYFVTNYFISADSYFSKFSQMARYDDEMTSPFPSLGSLSAVLSESHRCRGPRASTTVRVGAYQSPACSSRGPDSCYPGSMGEIRGESCQDPRLGLPGLPPLSWRTTTPLHSPQDTFHLPVGR